MSRLYMHFIAITLIAGTFGCKKTSEINSTGGRSIIEEAKQYYDQEIIQGQTPADQPTGTNNSNAKSSPRRTSVKSPLWDKANTIRLSTGEGVVVPLQYQKPFVIKSNLAGNKLFSIDDIARLLIYKDVNKKYHAEIISYFPDSSYRSASPKNFSGIARVENLSGDLIRTYKYQPNSKTVVYDPAVSLRAAKLASNVFEVCYEMSGYNYSPSDPDNGYYWTESLGCTTYFIGEEEAPKSSLEGGDYVSAGGGGGAAPGVGQSNVATVLPGNNIIANFKDYAKCFDNIAGNDYAYKVTLCVDQPDPGSRAAWTMSNEEGSSKSSNLFNVGHTFLTLNETGPAKTIVRNVGFYPSGSVDPYSPTSPGALNNDESHDYNISLTFTVTASQFNSLLEFITQAGNTSYIYNLNSFNCTSFALNALSSIGVELPRTAGSWLGGGGNDPGDLGEDIREMKLSSGMTRSTTQTAHYNKGTCN